MDSWKRLKNKLGGLGVYALLRRWMSTLDYQKMLYDPTVDPIDPGFQPPVIYAFWHEYIPCPIYLRPHCRVAMLISRHRDADWLGEAARHMGFRIIRGSTSRGGSAAIRELVRASRQMSLAITPDGPRGPRRRVAQGCVYLASRLQVPLVVFGVGYDRPWRVPTWDRFAIPRPYSRARVVMSPALRIPADLDRDSLERHRQLIEAVLHRLTDEAEDWARTGERRCGQQALCSQAMRKMR